MAWTVANNCHVRVWLGQTPPGPPVGAPLYDGPAQQLAPLEIEPGGTWLTRVVLPEIALPLPVVAASLINPGASLELMLAFVDDFTGNIIGYYLGEDLSPSFSPGPGPGQAQINCYFISLTTAGLSSGGGGGGAPSILMESGPSSKISGLPAAAALAGTEPTAIVQAGADVQASAATIAGLSGFLGDGALYSPNNAGGDATFSIVAAATGVAMLAYGFLEIQTAGTSTADVILGWVRNGVDQTMAFGPFSTTNPNTQFPFCAGAILPDPGTEVSVTVAIAVFTDEVFTVAAYTNDLV